MIILDQDLFFIEVIFNVFIIIDNSTRHRWGWIEDRVKLDARVSIRENAHSDLRFLIWTVWKDSPFQGRSSFSPSEGLLWIKILYCIWFKGRNSIFFFRYFFFLKNIVLLNGWSVWKYIYHSSIYYQFDHAV